ncbi:MAG: VOC family protein, partial [Dehalococcoidales bacterium]|nr:VOC family protein [Dehalococcoidales bacterium]
YQDMFGLKQMTPIQETRWGFRSTMMGNGEESFIEIMQPISPSSPVARFMKETSRPLNPHGEGIYVTAIEVDDLEEAVKNIRDRGGKVTQDPAAPDVAWVHPLTARYVFIELHLKQKSG